MESLIEIREGCEKLWPTFEFYYGRADGMTDGHRLFEAGDNNILYTKTTFLTCDLEY
jgi:hypothetical protein